MILRFVPGSIVARLRLMNSALNFYRRQRIIPRYTNFPSTGVGFSCVSCRTWNTLTNRASLPDEEVEHVQGTLSDQVLWTPRSSSTTSPESSGQDYDEKEAQPFPLTGRIGVAEGEDENRIRRCLTRLLAGLVPPLPSGLWAISDNRKGLERQITFPSFTMAWVCCSQTLTAFELCLSHVIYSKNDICKSRHIEDEI